MTACTSSSTSSDRLTLSTLSSMIDDIINQIGRVFMSVETSNSRVRRVRPEIKRRAVTGARVEPLTPGFRSIVFRDDSLTDFVSASFDDHVKFILDADGLPPVMRDYTPRRFDAE